MRTVQLPEIRHLFGLVVATLVSARASFWFFKGSLTGSPPLYSHGWLQRALHFFAGILFAALALFASVKLYSRLSVTSAASLTPAVVPARHRFTGYPPISVAQTTPPTLLNRIPKADPKKYQAIRDGQDWKNPKMFVRPDRKELR